MSATSFLPEREVGRRAIIVRLNWIFLCATVFPRFESDEKQEPRLL